MFKKLSKETSTRVAAAAGVSAGERAPRARASAHAFDEAALIVVVRLLHARAP
jgi:hypothetical protein